MMAGIKAVAELPRCSDRVGARHSPPLTLIRGGGYPDICTDSRILSTNDHRLRELEAIGLSDPWLSIAHTIGIDQFLVIWEMLDAENRGIARGGRQKVRVWIPLYATYLRHRRNQYIKALAAQRLRCQEIQKRVRAELRERISVRHIARIIAAD